LARPGRCVTTRDGECQSRRNRCGAATVLRAISARNSIGDHFGLTAAPFDTWRGRTRRGDVLVGASLRQLAPAARDHAARPRYRRRRAEHPFADGQELDVDTVVWATGYRLTR
jgi:hypothetical protein